MADIIDMANDRAEQDLQRAVTAARTSNGLEAAATGYCLHCDAVVGQGARWCNTDCRDDWQRNNRNRRQ